MGWWTGNAEAIEAFAAVITACVATAALIAAKIQLDHNDLIQCQQSARDACRAHLALAATQLQFARPGDACTLVQSTDGGAYVAHVHHLLYSAEQMLTVEEGWSATFEDQLTSHTGCLCSAFAPFVSTGEMSKLMDRFASENCSLEPAC